MKTRLKAGQLALGLLLLFVTGMQGVYGQCDDVGENSFDILCISQSGDGTAAPVTSNILDIYDLNAGAPGTDGTGDIQITMEAVVCNAGCNQGGPYEIGACLGNPASGMNALGTSSDFASNFNHPNSNGETTCDGAGGYIIYTIDFLNGFSTTAAGFDLPQSSNNGATEGYEGTFGWVTGATDANGTALTGLPAVNMGNFCSYTSSDYATTQMSTFVGATGAGSWQTDDQNTTANQTGGTMNSDANGQNICSGPGATTSQNGEDTASGTGADQGTSAASANANLGLAPTDIITQIKWVYFVSTTPAIDCDGDGVTAVNTNPSGSWTGIDFCGPPAPPEPAVECGTCMDASGGFFITELSYDPSSTQGTDGNCEFIEIFNGYSNAITLSSSTTLVLSGGTSATIPTGTTIAAGEYIIITGSNFSGCSWTNAVPAGTQVFDLGLSGTLSNSGESVTITLSCTDDASANFTQTISFSDGMTPDAGGGGNSVYYIWDVMGNIVVTDGEPTPGTGNCTGCGNEYSCVAPCPDLSGLTDGMLDIDTTNSMCTMVDPNHSGGVIAEPATACPEGSTMMYSLDGGMTWSTTLPTYDQDMAITVDTRCECDEDDSVVSPTSSVTTIPGDCPVCPTDGAITYDGPKCPGETFTFTADDGMTLDASNWRFFVDANSDQIEDATEGVQTMSSTWSSSTLSDGDQVCVSIIYGTIGCHQIYCLTVDYHDLPTADAGADVSLCEGEDLDLEATGGDSYTWSNGDNTSVTTVSPTTTTTYIVTATDANGCTATDEAVVTVIPAVTLAVDPVTVCEGATSAPITYTMGMTSCPIAHTLISYTGGMPFTNVNLNTPPPADFIIPGTLAPGAYDGILTIVCENGCSVNAPFTITVVENLTIEIADQTICLGEEVTLEATGGASYEWSDGSTTAILTDSPTATTTYTVTVTDANGCSGTTDVEVLVNGVPDCQVTIETDCIGGNLNLNEMGGDAVSWDWDGPNSFSSTTQNPSVTGTVAADYGIYTVTVTDANGCTSTCEVEANMPSPPVLNEDAFIQACQDATGSNMGDFNLSDAEDLANGDVDGDGADGSTATVTYHATMADAVACINPLNNSMNLTSSIPIFAKVEDASGCFSIAEVDVFIFNIPEYTLSATAVSDCHPDTDDGEIIVSGLFPGSGYTIEFTAPGSTMVSLGITADANGEFVFTGLTGGSYSMVILFTTINANLMCEGTPLEIEIPFPDPPVVTFNEITICEGATEVPIDFTSDCDNILHITLFFDMAAQSAGFPSNMTQTSGFTYTIPAGLAPGTYNGAGSVTCTNHCNASDLFSITVVEDPEIEITQDSDGCTGEELTFTVSATGGTGTAEYTFYTDADFDGFEEVLQTGASTTLVSTTIPNGAPLRVECIAAGDCIAENSLTVVREEPCPIYDVALMKVLTSAGPFAIGDMACFDIEVFNQGNQPVYNVLVEDYLPIGLDFCAADNTGNDFAGNPDTAGGGTVMAMVPSIPVNGSVVISIKLKIDATAQNGTIFNVAEITSATGDADGMEPIDDEDDDLGNTDGGLGDETDDEITDGAMDDAMDEDDFDFAALTICTVGCNGTFPWDGQE